MVEQNNQEKMVSVIIPAHNETKNIGLILDIACRSNLVDEIIVVDDGSDDDTRLIARKYTPHVITLPKNSGKATAMDVGVSAAKNEIITFLDADIIGYTTEKLDSIIIPVLDGRYEMFAGLRDKKLFWINKIARITPIISGERTLTKKLWYTIPNHYKQKFQIEIALNFFAKMTKKGMGFRPISGVNHVKKEQKYGFWYGQYRRFGMMKDLLFVGFKVYVVETLRLFFRTKIREWIKNSKRV